MQLGSSRRYLGLALVFVGACFQGQTTTDDDVGEDTGTDTTDTDEPGGCTPDPCQNGGTCIEQDEGYVCICEPGWEGDDCEINTDDCAGVTCSGNGTCIDGVDEYTCQCDEHWEGDDCSTYMDPCEELACVNGSCTDEPGYFICHCDPGWTGPQCDQLGMPFCLRGQLTIQDAFDMVNGTPATGAFEPFEGATIDFNFRFDVANHSTMIGDGMFSPNGQLRLIETGPITLEFSEAWFTDVFGAAFADTNQVVTLVNGDFQGIYLGNWVSPAGPEYWGFELTSGPLPLVIGEDGYPALLPSINPGEGSPILRRYQNMGPLMSDYAATTWSVQLLNGDDCL